MGGYSRSIGLIIGISELTGTLSWVRKNNHITMTSEATTAGHVIFSCMFFWLVSRQGPKVGLCMSVNNLPKISSPLVAWSSRNPLTVFIMHGVIMSVLLITELFVDYMRDFYMLSRHRLIDISCSSCSSIYFCKW